MFRRPTSSKGPGHPAGVGMVLGLALGPAIVLGLARFAYALLLPSMRSDLHWSFATAGAMNTANAVGYLVGALLTTAAARRWGTRRAFIASTSVTVVALLATGATGNTAVLVSLRTVTGISGAITFIAGAALVAAGVSTLSPRRATTLLGIYFSGAGVGIVTSGLAIPYLLDVTSSSDGWRWGWVLLSVLGVLALAIAIPVALASTDPPTPPLADRHWPARHLAVLLACYGLFGAGYIAYMTFIVAFLKEHGTGTGQITTFWVVLGVAAMAGALVWARPLARLRGGLGLAVVLAVLSVGALLPLVSHSSGAALGSAVLFGGSFLSVITAVTSVVRRLVQPHHWTGAIAGLTVAFALGQCLGPVLAGALSDGPAGLRLGLEVSVGVLIAGTLGALTLRRLETSIPGVVARDAVIT